MQDPRSTLSRRRLFRAAGVGALVLAAPAALAACGGDGDDGDDLGSGPGTGPALQFDFGVELDVLRYAAALEELEGAFYDRAIENVDAAGFTAAEQAILTELWENETAHRAFFRTLLGANLPAVTPVFAGTDFRNRGQVLEVLQRFCDTGVSAYNGSGRYLTGENLVTAGKIVSVEARHVAALRTIRFPGGTEFAGDDVVNPATGLDVVNGLDPLQGLTLTRTPNDVLAIVQPFAVESMTVVRF